MPALHGGAFAGISSQIATANEDTFGVKADAADLGMGPVALAGQDTKLQRAPEPGDERGDNSPGWDMARGEGWKAASEVKRRLAISLQKFSEDMAVEDAFNGGEPAEC